MRQETPEEKAKRERQEKSRRIIAATVDGASALANLFFTTRYAPNANNPRSSQLGKVNERIEALKAERQADADRYNSIMLRLGDAQNARAKTLRDLKVQQEAQKLAREKAERDAEQHGWLALLQPDKQREQKGKADRAESEAVSAQAEAENAPAMQQAKLQTEKARKGSYEASAAASRASATNSYASASAHNRSNVSEYKGLGKNGTYESFRDRQAAIDFERREGTYDPSHWGDDVQTETERTVTENLEGTTTRTTSKKTRPKGKGYGDNASKGAGY